MTSSEKNWKTRGVRNCNPLNIRVGNNWLGEAPVSNDAEFEVFVSPVMGLRAAFKLIRRYIDVYHCNSISRIISRWAPRSENATEDYIKFVCQSTGIGADDELVFSDKWKIIKIVQAMAKIESQAELTLTDLNAAYNLSLV